MVDHCIPTIVSCPAPFEAPAVANDELVPAVVMSRKELLTPKPLVARRPLPLTPAFAKLPILSLVLEASDLESSGAVRCFGGGICPRYCFPIYC